MISLALAVILAGAPKAPAPPPTTTRIEGSALAASMESALQGLDVHLDCDVIDAEGKHIGRSYVSLPEKLGGGRTLFSIPDQLVDLGSLGRVTYQLRDVNLSKLQVRANEKDYVLTLWFEDQGLELVPARSKAGGFGQLAPDVNLDQMRLDVTLTPKEGAAQIERGKVKFDADIRPVAQGLGALAGGEAFSGMREALRREIEKQINQSLASPELIAALNAQLKTELANQVKSGSIDGAHFEGTDVVIEKK
jgi:hypothetical protein